MASSGNVPLPETRSRVLCWPGRAGIFFHARVSILVDAPGTPATKPLNPMPDSSAVRSPRFRLCPVLLLLALLAGCIEATPGPDEPASEPLYFEPIGLGQTALLADTTELLIRDAALWEAYQDSLRPLGAFAPVDFEQAMVLLVAVPVTTGGYSVQVETVERLEDEVVARYMLTIPDDDCIPMMSAATPFQAVLVRRAPGEVRFERETEPFHCQMR